jgi:hypothetical protein
MTNGIVLGAVVRVDNKERNDYEFGRNQCKNYLAIQVENFDGEGERCLLLTDKEYFRFTTRCTQTDLLSVMVKGRMYKSVLEKSEVVFVRVFEEQEERCLLIPCKYLEKIDKRSQMHKSTLTKKDLLTDLFD